MSALVPTQQGAEQSTITVFCVLNASGVYLKIGILVPAINRDPAFISEVLFCEIY